jgi:hypothetical protein
VRSWAGKFCILLGLAAAIGARAAENPAPALVRIGSLALKPSGFFETIGETRSNTDPDSVSTSFGNIPLANTPDESLVSVAHSRLQLKGDLPVGAVRVSGYAESDFLNPNPDSAPWRWRQYWGSAAWRGWEVLGGKAWSLLRPNRVGVSPEKDLLNTDVIEPAYHVGLAGVRRRQVRVVREFGRQHLALAWENNGNYVAKLTTDRSAGHFEVTAFSGRSGRRGAGAGAVINAGGRVRFITAGLWSRRDIAEALGVIPAGISGAGAIQGVEVQASRSLELYAYGGAVYGDRSSGNRTVRQWSTGFNYRKPPPGWYGAMLFSVQYSYVDRAVWDGRGGNLHYVMCRMRYAFN